MNSQRKITHIWFRVLQPGEFFNIERHPTLASGGGGGARYIEVPNSMTDATRQFFEVAGDVMAAGDYFSIDAVPIGSTDGVAYPIEFKVKTGSRLRIANQNRQANPNRRHPAWSHARGFPKAPNDVKSTEEARTYLPEGGVRIFIGKLNDGSYLAGFTEGSVAPSTISPGMSLNRLWSNGEVGGVLWNVNLPIAEAAL